MTAPSIKEALEAAVRAANLALFVIRKQGVMPNSSWEGGFNRDLKIAEAALATLSPPADVTALLTECRKFIAYAACYDDDVQSHKQRDDLVSRIDAFTVGRR